MVEPRLEIAHVTARRHVEELEHLLDVPIERLLVLHEPSTGTAEALAHAVVGHDLVEDAGETFLAELAQPTGQIGVVAAGHILQLSIGIDVQQTDELARQHHGRRVRIFSDGLQGASGQPADDVDCDQSRACADDRCDRDAPPSLGSVLDGDRPRPRRVGSRRDLDPAVERRGPSAADKVSAYFGCCLRKATVGSKTPSSALVPAITSRCPQSLSVTTFGSGSPVECAAAATMPGHLALKFVLAKASTGIFDSFSASTSFGVNGLSPSCTAGQ